MVPNMMQETYTRVSDMLIESKEIRNDMMEEIKKARELNRINSRNGMDYDYAQCTMFICGMYKAMEIMGNYERKEMENIAAELGKDSG